MNKPSKHNNLRIVEVRRGEPDLRMLARVLLIWLSQQAVAKDASDTTEESAA